MRKTKKKIIPDLIEFTDNDGKKWIQTSAEDIFAMKELDDIIDSISSDKDKDEIVLARIDFQKVNKEYYETVVALQAEYEKQNKDLKKLIINAKETIDRKNRKLKELVNYIKKLHLVLAYYKMDPDNIDKMMYKPENLVFQSQRDEKKTVEEVEKSEEIKIDYTEVQEILLSDDGEEILP